MTDGNKLDDMLDRYKSFPVQLLSVVKDYAARRASAARSHVLTAAENVVNILLQNLRRNIVKPLAEHSTRLHCKIYENSELIRLIDENINEVIWIADAALTKTLYVSPGYETVMGLTCESLYEDPRSFLKAVHPEDMGRLTADMEVLKKGLPFDHDYRVVHPDGSVRWIWSRGFPDKKSGMAIYVGVIEDITDRKQMEFSLKEERNVLRTMIDAMQDELAIHDREYNIVFQTESSKSIFGAKLGEKCYRVFEGNDAVCDGCPVEMSYNDGKPHTSVRKIKLPDGQTKYYENTANPIRDAGGAIVSCLEIVRDVTESRLTVDAIRASEEKYRSLLDGAGDAIVIIGLDGLIIDANKKADELLGIAQDRIVGMHYEELLMEVELDRTRAAFQGTVANGYGQLLNLQVRNADASAVPVDITASLVQYGGGKVIQVIARDIRRRLELEKRIDSEHAFRKALEACAVSGIAVVDTQGRQIYANPSFCKMTGYSEDEMIGALPPHIFWAPEDLDNIETVLKAAIEGNLPNKGADVVFRKKSDERINVNIRVSRLIDADGNLYGILGSMNDITSRKAMEDELKLKTELLGELNYNLKELVNSKVDELRRKEQLLIQQSKMAAMGEMMSAIAHQWRQPLNSLGLIVQDLRDAFEYGELDAAYIGNTVENSMKQLNFMSSTVDVFKNFFMPSQEKETFDVIGVSAEAFSLISSQLKTNSILYRITCHIHDRTFTHYADVVPCDATVVTTYKNHLAHVLLNLITNARDAIVKRREDGMLSVEGMIAVDCHREGGLLRIEVSDNGGGIPEDVINDIFDQYFTTKADKGTGIGLYMSKVIVEGTLDGKIYAANKDDGAVFTVELHV